MSFHYRIAHSITGRLRLYLAPYPKKDSKALIEVLKNKQGIQKVRMNDFCGCVILHYDPKIITRDELLTICQKLSPDKLKQSNSFSHRTQDECNSSSPLPLVLSTAAVASGIFWDSALVPWFLLGASLPIFQCALKAFFQKGKINVDTLDASATTLLLGQGQYMTAATMVWLISLGNFIRDATVRQSHKAIEKLFDGHEQSAWVVRKGKKMLIKVDRIQPKDEVVVYPGELIPVDGPVLMGKATVDQKILTGESMPVEKEKGSYVYAGTVVREGKLYLKAKKTGADTTKAKIIHLVNNAPVRETKVQNYAELFADRLVPWSFLGAGAFLVGTGNINKTVSLLIVDYGTGIRIAAPTTVLSSIAKAARQGILIKGGKYLETLAEVDTIVFDKTGTLTTGDAEVIDIISYYPKISPDEILTMAAAAENRLTHPVAEAIVRSAKNRGLAIPERESSEYTIGLGIEATVKGAEVLVGCHRFMEQKKIPVGKADKDILNINGRAAAPLFVALDGTLIALLIYTDPIRPETPNVLKTLRRQGIKNIVMLTGDHPAIAENVAQTLGISHYIAEAFPEEKAEVVKSLQKKGHRVAVIGDGINDTPALVQADVGISIKGGADVAIETAHVAFLSGNLQKLPQAIAIARESMALIRQNWKLNLYPNTGAIALALFGVLGPVGTTIISNGSAIIASLNALRPLFTKAENGV